MKKEVKIVALTAVLAFLGSTAGAFLSFQLSKNAWEREVQYEHRNLTIKQRIELIERLAKAVAHLEEVEKNLKLIEIDSEARSIELEQGKSPPIISELSEKLSNRVIQIEAEYSAILSMVPIFYGPNTKSAVEKLLSSQVWYKPKKEDIVDLYDAMGGELYWFPL